MRVRPLDDILRILPRRCKFNGCAEFVTAKDDHEELCGYRPTACKTCDWKGCVKDIIDHVQTEFEPLDILREKTTGVVLRDCSSILGVLWYPHHVRNNLTPNKLECFYPMLAYEQMFWLNFTTDLIREELRISITSVPQQKFTSLFNVTFSMEKDRRVFRISSTIFPEDLLSNRDVLFSLTFSTVERFIERDFTLVYSLNIDTIN